MSKEPQSIQVDDYIIVGPRSWRITAIALGGVGGENYVTAVPMDRQLEGVEELSIPLALLTGRLYRKIES